MSNEQRSSNYQLRAVEPPASEIEAEIMEQLAQRPHDRLCVEALALIQRLRMRAPSAADHYDEIVQDALYTARRIGPTEPDDTMVICPVCTSQFRAIPLDVQRQLAFLSAPKGSEAAALVDEIERLQRRVAEPHPGTGVKCAHCNGSGKEAQVYDEQTGWSDEKACDTCNGSGRITTVEQYLKTLPANWHEDSGLATWFPITAEEIERLRQQRDQLLAALKAIVSNSMFAGKFDHCGFMNATALSDRDLFRKLWANARDAIEKAEGRSDE